MRCSASTAARVAGPMAQILRAQAAQIDAAKRPAAPRKKRTPLALVKISQSYCSQLGDGAVERAVIRGRARSRWWAARSPRRPARAVCAASASACPLARVTTMRRPNSGSRSNQSSFSRSRTTSPTMMVAGGFMPCSAMRPGSVASVPQRVSWSGRVAQRTAMAGVSAARPRAISSRGDLGEGGEAHEDHQCFGVAHLAPVDRSHRVAGDEGDRRGVLAMRERHAGIGGDAAAAW